MFYMNKILIYFNLTKIMFIINYDLYSDKILNLNTLNMKLIKTKIKAY